MIKSMTGFGRGVSDTAGGTYTVEMKSVNHRYIDISVRMPRDIFCLEDRVKKEIQKYVKRGKLDVFINFKPSVDSEKVVTADRGLAAAYITALNDMASEFGIKNNVSTSDLFRIPELFTIQQKEYTEDELWEMLVPAVDEAVEKLCDMRAREGRNIYSNFHEILDNIVGYFENIKNRAGLVPEEYRKKLTARITEVLESTSMVDPQRLAAEVAYFADKCCIDEEITRFESHIAEFRKYMDSDIEIGRKVDFLIQEMNREVNTMGSKANDSELVTNVIAIKGEIEKLREQIQNIE
ncbi:MAG: YicC family protein [Ruminococcaceae bacterium]|nr:YicC family protein [Oscillospiraceae bacterium]